MIRKRTTMTTHEKRRRMLLCLFGVILVGVSGSVLGLVLGWWNDGAAFGRLTGDFFHAPPDFITLVFQALRGTGLFLLGLFFLGFSAVGQPVAVLLLGMYGFCLGSGLVQMILRQGELWGLMCLLPYDVPACALLVLATRESLRFSGRLTGYVFRDDPSDQMLHQLRLYCVRFVVLLALLVVLSAVYGLLFYAFRTVGAIEQMGI